MAEKVFKIFIGRPTEAWYQLSEERQNDLLAQIRANLEKLGVTSTALCDSSWSSEEWHFFGLEEYPDMDAVRAHTAFLNEISWFRYGEFRTLLGSEMQIA